MPERKSKTLFVDLPEHLRDKEMIAESCDTEWSVWYLRTQFLASVSMCS
ncbi:hypothetical protein [Maridesulfovibrio salexigens]|uniref:Uncharacterized protein n=1 Tax=Maridesulfovibrio salexigens (strain ATCC 14822 / DSM 2638 / NCIMB 8403 / VKM B-1763) TaxID=526222 RepID=C6BWD8_MARSD|nr:hypothetical protein [Maridesulfovibrio salexigens]ACS78382.1 hypothetical protein Desal_0315 [Maridesulfovibrio salexigens DSM 2638]